MNLMIIVYVIIGLLGLWLMWEWIMKMIKVIKERFLHDIWGEKSK